MDPTKMPVTFESGWLTGVSSSVTGPSVESVDELIASLSSNRVATCTTTELKCTVYIDDRKLYRGQVEIWWGDQENTTSEVFTEDIERLRKWCEFWWSVPLDEDT